MVENPFGATGREIRVDEQSGFLLHHLTIASLFQLVADLRTAHALPYHGVAYGLAGGLIPHDDGLTLVGDRQGVVVLFEVLVFQQFFHHPQGVVVYLFRIMLHPSGFGIILLVRFVDTTEHLTLFIEQHGFCGRGALVDGDDVILHG